MLPETALTNVLLSNTAITSVVASRVSPVAVRAATALPAITYARQSGSRDYTFDGKAQASVTLSVTAWASDWLTARTVADLARAALDKYTSNTIDMSTASDGADTYDPDASAYGCTLLITMSYEEV
jgi:hypothetical protein